MPKMHRIYLVETKKDISPNLCEWCFKVIFWRILSKWQFSHNPNRNPSRYGIFTKKSRFWRWICLFAWVLDAVKTFPGENPNPHDLGGCHFLDQNPGWPWRCGSLGFIFTFLRCLLVFCIYIYILIDVCLYNVKCVHFFSVQHQL